MSINCWKKNYLTCVILCYSTPKILLVNRFLIFIKIMIFSDFLPQYVFSFCFCFLLLLCVGLNLGLPYVTYRNLQFFNFLSSYHIIWVRNSSFQFSRKWMYRYLFFSFPSNEKRMTICGYENISDNDDWNNNIFGKNKIMQRERERRKDKRMQILVSFRIKDQCQSTLKLKKISVWEKKKN